ncbi:MAG: CPBP family intramembrane metalloprotease [Acidobacteriia bacterium]|jgi:membrane protease YdiL (CAAX protease family)|nr:CPBP family intramembrane metalloprotease [Terriglobia bacterium]
MRFLQGRIFHAADGRLRAIWRAVLYVPLCGGLTLVAQTVAVLVVEVVAPETKLAADTMVLMPPRFAIPLYALTIVAALAAAWWMLEVFDHRSFRTLGISFDRNWWREWLLGFSLGAALIAAVVGATAVSGVVRLRVAPDEFTFAEFFSLGVVLLLAAAWEEIIFRGYPFQRLVESVGALWAVVLLAALFGAVHIPNPAATALSTANTVLAGVLLAVAYLKTRALWLPIGIHFAWNWVMGPVLGFPVSGIRMPARLLAAEVSGPVWLSGGDYGPEGSVVLTAAAVAGTVWLMRTRAIYPSPDRQEVLQ